MSYDLLLLPRDGFFVKDGRGWFTTGARRAHGHDWPPPPTVRGALTGAVGRLAETTEPLTTDQWLEYDRQVRLSRCVALRLPLGGQAGPEHRLWPAPADALWLDNQPLATRLDPRPNEAVATLGCEPDGPAREAFWWPQPEATSKPRSRPPRWWSEQEFASWLRGEKVCWPGEACWSSPNRRVETHLAINPETRTAAEGMLFSHDVVETAARPAGGPAYAYGLACRAELPSDITGSWLTLGGRSRLVAATAAPGGWDDPPDGLIDALSGCRRLRLIVVTPALFERGWLPDGLDATAGGRAYVGSLAGLAVTLRAAFVGRPYHLSGWSIRPPGPKRTERLVAPGSVYFLELSESLDANQARGLWLTAVGGRTDHGLGVVVPGVWPEASPRSQA